MPKHSAELLAIFSLMICVSFLRTAHIAFGAARKNALKKLAKKGDKKAKHALALASDPAAMAPSVELSIFLIAIIVSAISGAMVQSESSLIIPPESRLAIFLLRSVVIAVVSLFFVLFAEVIPRDLGNRYPVVIARHSAVAMNRWCKALSPLVNWLYPAIDEKRKMAPSLHRELQTTTKELAVFLEDGPREGKLLDTETEMLTGVLRLEKTRISSLMTPRKELVWLDTQEPQEVMIERLKELSHTRCIAAAGSLDNILGVVNTRDLFLQLMVEGKLDLKAALFQPLIVPENKMALEVLEQFKTSKLHIAFVMDEYGSLRGLVTMSDILTAVVGDQTEIGEPERFKITDLDDGSKIFDAVTPIAHFKRVLDLSELPGEEVGAYNTVGGFVLFFLERVPAVSETFQCEGLDFKVLAMDGHRIDKIMITRSQTLST